MKRYWNVWIFLILFAVISIPAKQMSVQAEGMVQDAYEPRFSISYTVKKEMDQEYPNGRSWGNICAQVTNAGADFSGELCLVIRDSAGTISYVRDIEIEADDSADVEFQITETYLSTTMGLVLRDENGDDICSQKVQDYSEDSYISIYRYLKLKDDNLYAVERKHISVGLYAGILSSYIVICMLLCMVCQKQKKERWLWYILPGAALLCGITIYITGGVTRETSPQIYYVSFRMPGERKEKETVYVAAATSENKDYEVRLDSDYEISYITEKDLSARYALDYQQESAVIVERRGDYQEIALKKNSAFQTEYFIASAEHEAREYIAADLVYTENGVRGTIRNQTAYDLEHGGLFNKYIAIPTGPIKSGETVTIEAGYDSEILQPESVWEAVSGAVEYGGDGENEQHKYSIMSMALRENVRTTAEQLLFVAFTEEPTELLRDTEIGYSGSNVVMQYVDTGQEDADQVIISDIRPYRHIRSQIYDLELEALSEYTYEFPDNLMGETAELAEPLPDGVEVQFWEYGTRTYVPVFTDGSVSITDLQKYMEPNNRITIKIRYTVDEDEWAEPRIRVTGRWHDAED